MSWWSTLSQALATALARYGLPAAFVLVAVEEAGVPSPVPADLLVLLLGVQARTGGAPLWQVLAASECATILGASVLFHVARRAGRDVVYRYGRYVGLGPARLDPIEVRLQGAGVWTIAVARLTPGVRVLVALACGIFGVPYRVFLPGMALGALAYLLLFALLGYYVGPSVAATLERVHLPLSSLLSLLLFGLVVVWLARARRAAPRGLTRPGPRARARAGLVAGTLAAIASALAFNAEAGLIGAAASLAGEPSASEAAAVAAVTPGWLAALVASVLAVGLVGAVWGALYGLWAEPLLARILPGDAARGIVYSLAPLALVVGSVWLVAGVDDVGALLVAFVQALQQATFGAVLGLAYPLLRERIASGRGPLGVRAAGDRSSTR